MDYNKLSDREINKLVAYQLGYTQQGEGWIDNADGIYWYILKPEEGYRYSLPNYCNNWGEAGPIIETYQIGLSKSGAVWRSSHLLNGYFYDDKPLRAAMIVFLMLKGVE